MNDLEKLYQEKCREDRAQELGLYLAIHPEDSLREISKIFGYSVTMIWFDLQRLREIDSDLYKRCRDILEEHKSGDYIRSKIGRN